VAIWRLCFIDDLTGCETWRNASSDGERSRIVSQMSRLGASLILDVNMEIIDRQLREPSSPAGQKAGGNGGKSGKARTGRRSELRRKETLFNRYQGKQNANGNGSRNSVGQEVQGG
jgi:hypothetical protein